jgi:hypothetical protein
MEEQTQNPMENDPQVLIAQKIVEVEKRLAEGLKGIQQILAMMIKDKIDLDKIKGEAKEYLNQLVNEQEVQQ